MATKHHYEALRKQRVLQRAKEAKERMKEDEQEYRNEEPKLCRHRDHFPSGDGDGRNKSTSGKKNTKEQATQTGVMNET